MNPEGGDLCFECKKGKMQPDKNPPGNGTWLVCDSCGTKVKLVFISDSGVGVDTVSVKSKQLTRDVRLVAVGVFLSMAFQALDSLLKAIVYPSLFFPPTASLWTYEETEFLLFLGGVILAIYIVREISKPQR